MDFLVKDLIKLNYFPQLENFKFHKSIVDILKNDMILFDTLFHGSSGSGKLTLFMGYLQKLFGEGALTLYPNSESKMNDVTFNLEKVGAILSNNNLAIINDSVSDDTVYDFITKQFDIEGDNLTYIIILHLDRFKEKTISCIMNFIERRKSRTYILTTTNHYDKLTAMTKSRFESFMISRPTSKELTDYFTKLIPKKFEFPSSKIEKIIETTNRDIKLTSIYINQRLLESIDPGLKKKSLDNFKYYINCLIQLMTQNDLKTLPMMRSMILTLFQSAITWNDYIKKTHEVLFTLPSKIIKDTQKCEIIRRSAELDNKVALTKASYIHYEAFMFMIYDVLFCEY
jgi:hypothetical protein